MSVCVCLSVCLFTAGNSTSQWTREFCSKVVLFILDCRKTKLTIVGELAGGVSAAVAVDVSDM